MKPNVSSKRSVSSYHRQQHINKCLILFKSTDCSISEFARGSRRGKQDSTMKWWLYGRAVFICHFAFAILNGTARSAPLFRRRRRRVSDVKQLHPPPATRQYRAVPCQNRAAGRASRPAMRPRRQSPGCRAVANSHSEPASRHSVVRSWHLFRRVACNPPCVRCESTLRFQQTATGPADVTFALPACLAAGQRPARSGNSRMPAP